MSWQEDFKIEFTLSNQQIQCLSHLLDLLSGYTAQNLTSVSDLETIIDIHFRDSLSLLSFDEFETAKRIVDIGSGAGFPGLPLAIARPGLSFSLIEANIRKCSFIELAAERLKLDNVRVINMRAEDAARSDLRESFDLVLARAVGSLPVVLEYALPLLKIAGAALFQRGAREAHDTDTAIAVSSLLGGDLKSIKPVAPYPAAKNLHVWTFSKKSKTPQRFPRRAGMAKKHPMTP